MQLSTSTVFTRYRTSKSLIILWRIVCSFSFVSSFFFLYIDIAFTCLELNLIKTNLYTYIMELTLQIFPKLRHFQMPTLPFLIAKFQISTMHQRGVLIKTTLLPPLLEVQLPLICNLDLKLKGVFLSSLQKLLWNKIGIKAVSSTLGESWRFWKNMRLLEIFHSYTEYADD